MTAPGRSSRTGDHPRVGGEKHPSQYKPKLHQGSPPHGRGKGLRQLSGVAHHRSTPAWAGKSIRCTSTTRLIRDHPRMGGEKSLYVYMGCNQLGSPPRGRGKDPNFPEKAGATGITPAWAGKSGIAEDEHPQAEDHPRVGGEKEQGLVFPHIDIGSPPRGRGKVFPAAGGLNDAGITPAWAGKSQLDDRQAPGR